VRWQKQVFIHTPLSRAYLALARLSCRLYIFKMKDERRFICRHTSEKYHPISMKLSVCWSKFRPHLWSRVCGTRRQGQRDWARTVYKIWIYES